MDEPTASLTRHEVDALIKLVSDLKRTGICIVFREPPTRRGA